MLRENSDLLLFGIIYNIKRNKIDIGLAIYILLIYCVKARDYMVKVIKQHF